MSPCSLPWIRIGEPLESCLYLHNSCLFIFRAVIFHRSIHQPKLLYVPYNVRDLLYGAGARIQLEWRIHREDQRRRGRCLGRLN
jgi:hypothetical protein